MKKKTKLRMNAFTYQKRKILKPVKQSYQSLEEIKKILNGK